MKLGKLILLGTVSFAATAIWKTPANFVYQYVPHENMQLQGLSGTIWKGEADELITKNISVNNVAWSVDLLQSLLNLSLKTNVTVQDSEISANGLVGINLAQTITLDNAQFEATGSFISKLQKMAKLSGDIKGNITHLKLVKGELPELEASYQWKQGMLLAPMRIQPAGDYAVSISPDDNGLSAKISSKDAPLMLSGTAKIDDKWQYVTDIKIKPANASAKGTMNILRTVLGKLEADGSALIKQKGQLKPFY
ncbi:MAG TPA: type II secretion system protein N [Leucothrix mucor]|nr:type II secretion system protein N [Leucothrix mucor]